MRAMLLGSPQRQYGDGVFHHALRAGGSKVRAGAFGPVAGRKVIGKVHGLRPQVSSVATVAVSRCRRWRAATWLARAVVAIVRGSTSRRQWGLARAPLAR